MNGMGYIFYTISPLGMAFLKNECNAEKCVIEIGSGYNNIPIEALKQGVAEYVANDISLEHLKILLNRAKQKISQEAFDHLFFIAAKAPDELPLQRQKYDAILIDKVLHFFSPQEINKFIQWAKISLKKEGKIYVTVASPYSKLYKSILPKYLENQSKNLEFPGHFEDIMSTIDLAASEQNYNQYKVPNEMVLFDRHDLIKLFENHGMNITNSYAFKIPTDSEKEWLNCPDQEENMVGIIAQNK